VAAAHHDQPAEEQQAVSVREAAWLAGAPREDRAAVPSERVASALRGDGLARVDGVIKPFAAAALLAHVTDRLARALASEAALRAEQASFGDLSEDRGASPAPSEPLLGRLLCQSQRYDLKLDLRAPPVKAVLDQIVQSLGIYIYIICK